MRRTPRYFCVRLSWDGEHIHQLCDPTDGGQPRGNSSSSSSSSSSNSSGGGGGGSGGGGGGGGVPRLTGVVRGAIEEFWNDLRRAHYLDDNTRVMVITLRLTSNHVGVRNRVRLILEQMPTMAILPSYAVQTMVRRPEHTAAPPRCGRCGLAAR